MDISKKLRWLTISMLAAAGSLGALACASAENTVGTDVGASSDDIVKTEHTAVKRQSIGNCWIYASASWVEALNKRATGKELNVSESYWTYWHWFEQLANGSMLPKGEISTGGTIQVSTSLMLRYGIVKEGDFLPAEAESEMSGTQKTALAAINASLKSGALKDKAARKDKALVRAELDKAWNLSENTKAMLDKVFGKAVTTTLDRTTAPMPAGIPILRAKDIPAAVPKASQQSPVTATLADAIGVGDPWNGRTGELAYQSLDYPSDSSRRRAFEQRMQRALHAGAPVVISWFVDFNALTRDSKFSKAELDSKGPGHQGGHMTVLSDYQARLKDGTLLAAGVEATPQQMAAALATDTKIEFFRVKNSWGAIRPDRWDVGDGYHDLMTDYLNGPVKKCEEKADGSTDTTKCKDITPWWDAYLPAGY